MTLYKCGHTRDIIILDGNIISYSAYLDWAESVGINGTKELCWDCWNEKNCKIIDSQQVTDNQNNKVQRPSSDGSQKTADRILNWSTYCATTNQRNQCSKETCTIFPICKFKEVRG
jgi:hypothetical protein